MWTRMKVLFLITALLISSSQGSENHNPRVLPSTRSSAPGPFRLKFINKDSLPLDSILDGVSSYFSHALSVYNLLIPVTVPDCEGESIYEEDADFVIILKSSNQPFIGGGKSTVCSNEASPFENPLAATLLLSSSPNTFEELISILTANTIRAIGISNSQMSLWKKNQLAELYDQHPLVTLQTQSGQQIYLSTPKVIEKIGEAFGYNSLPGLLLNEELSVDDGIFWSTRYYRGEVLSFGFISENYVSSLTLAALEDSGWYFPDYSMAQLPFLGRGQGAGYFSSPCKEGDFGLDSSVWCSQPGPACSFFNLKPADCEVQAYYNGIGEIDGCALPLEHFGSCRTEHQSKKTPEESFGINSRCILSSLTSDVQNPLGSLQAICYEVLSCGEFSANIKIGEQIVECPFTGASISLVGFAGVIECPASDVLCQEVPCLNFCSGYGKCNKGICECFDGHYGDFCEHLCNEECVTCTSSFECTKCKDGFYISDGSCVRCDPSCLTCTTKEVCQTCADGFYLSGSSCSECNVGCSLCTAADQCSKCNLGYNLIDPFCCPSRCLTCTHQSCGSCLENYYLESGVCIDCPKSCQHCNNDVCDSCLQRFYLKQGSCSPCPENCLECSSDNYCTLCADGYLNNGSGVCILCPSRCSGCSHNVCSGCNLGYYINGAICCPDTCETCNLDVCWTCKPNYFFKNGKCEDCPSSCSFCLDGVCKGCKDHYYLSTPICEQCINNCNTCASSTFCYTCIDPYFLTDSNSCINCPNECTACMNGVCQGCIKGFYPLKTSCSKCPTGCSACSSPSSCSECASYYYLSASSCLPCPKFCITCQANRCLTCDTGYKLDDGLCEFGKEDNEGSGDCGDNCSACKSKVCSSCKVGFYLDSGKCIQCANNCAQCTGYWACRQCKEEFVLAYGICCPKTCESCSTTACYTCKQDFFLKDGNCVECPSSCSKCNQGVCVSCRTGFYISGSVCAKCTTGCSSCSSINWCDSCQSDYKLSNGKCIKR